MAAGRSWVVRDSTTAVSDGSVVTTPGVIDLGLRTTNGTAGVVRNDADVLIAGTQAHFNGLESTLKYQHGLLTLADGKVYETPVTYFRNAGEMSLRGAQFRQANGTFRNDGELTVGADSYLDVPHLHHAAGLLTVDGGVVDNESAQIASGVQLNSGIFKTEYLTLEGGDDFKMNGGALRTRSIDGSLRIDSGTFAPGMSVDVTTVSGALLLGPDGVLDIEWGRDGGDFIDVALTAGLSGTITLSLLDDFAPQVGDSLLFLSAQMGLGLFDVVLEPSTPMSGLALMLRQEANRLFIDVVQGAVSAPPALWLLSAMTLWLMAGQRRLPRRDTAAR